MTDPRIHRCDAYEVVFKDRYAYCTTCHARWDLDERKGWQRNPRPWT